MPGAPEAITSERRSAPPLLLQLRGNPLLHRAGVTSRVLQLRGETQLELVLSLEEATQRLWQLELDGLAPVGGDAEGLGPELDPPLARDRDAVHRLARELACDLEAVGVRDADLERAPGRDPLGGELERHARAGAEGSRPARGRPASERFLGRRLRGRIWGGEPSRRRDRDAGEIEERGARALVNLEVPRIVIQSDVVAGRVEHASDVVHYRVVETAKRDLHRSGSVVEEQVPLDRVTDIHADDRPVAVDAGMLLALVGPVQVVGVPGVHLRGEVLDEGVGIAAAALDHAVHRAGDAGGREELAVTAELPLAVPVARTEPGLDEAPRPAVVDDGGAVPVVVEGEQARVAARQVDRFICAGVDVNAGKRDLGACRAVE